MDIEKYRTYCLSKKGVTESTPFPKLQDVLVFKVMEKMFTATDINTFASISIKCPPNEASELRERFPAVQLPSYFSPNHWNRVDMDGSISDQQICEWLDTSYDLVVAGLTKKVREQLLKESAF